MYLWLLFREKTLVNTIELEKIIIKTWADKNYLRCNVLTEKILRNDLKNKIGLEYKNKLKSINLDKETDQWHNINKFDSSKQFSNKKKRKFSALRLLRKIFIGI